MKKLFFLLAFCGLIGSAVAQNQIRLKAGFLSTYTGIAEYVEPGNNYFLLDSVQYKQRVSSALAALEMDVELGKRFFLVTGFGYSRKGLPEITHTDFLGNTRSRSAFQNYLGVNFQLKYHYRFKECKFGLFLATGPKVDFAIGGPNYAEYSTVTGSEHFQAFGTFNIVEFVWYTNLGVSYKLGSGDLILDMNMMNGLNDVFQNKYLVGRTLSIGVSVGYSFYLN